MHNGCDPTLSFICRCNLLAPHRFYNTTNAKGKRRIPVCKRRKGLCRFSSVCGKHLAALRPRGCVASPQNACFAATNAWPDYLRRVAKFRAEMKSADNREPFRPVEPRFNASRFCSTASCGAVAPPRLPHVRQGRRGVGIRRCSKEDRHLDAALCRGGETTASPGEG